MDTSLDVSSKGARFSVRRDVGLDSPGPNYTAAQPPPRVLLLGGSGHLGTVLAQKLRFRTTVADIRAPQQSRTQYLAISALDTKALTVALRQHDVVVHLAALHGPDLDAGVSPESIYSFNVAAARAVAEAAEVSQPRQIVYLSTTSVFGARQTGDIRSDTEPAPSCAYGRSKLEAERIIRAASVRSVVLRPARFTFPDHNTRLRKFLGNAIDIEDLAQIIVNIISTGSSYEAPINLSAHLDYSSNLQPQPSVSVQACKVLAEYFDGTLRCDKRVLMDHFAPEAQIRLKNFYDIIGFEYSMKNEIDPWFRSVSLPGVGDRHGI